MKKKICRELAAIFIWDKKSVITYFLTVFCGVFTWICSDGGGIVWRFCRKAPFTFPAFFVFLLFIIACFFYGVLMNLCRCGHIKNSWETTVIVSFSVFLFWCPLTMLAASFYGGIAAVTAAFYLIFSIFCRKVSNFTFVLPVLIITVTELYFAYISLGIARLN